eukprot:1157310-Pelagomonas_calceolata.AAC.7
MEMNLCSCLWGAPGADFEAAATIQQQSHTMSQLSGKSTTRLSAASDIYDGQTRWFWRGFIQSIAKLMSRRAAFAILHLFPSDALPLCYRNHDRQGHLC